MHPDERGGVPKLRALRNEPPACALWQRRVRPGAAATKSRREAPPLLPQASPLPPGASGASTGIGTAHAPVPAAPGSRETSLLKPAALLHSARHPDRTARDSNPFPAGGGPPPLLN